ncbi:hypothetical protein P3G55_09405 [Leptospira sp. 96542]|nr:hypothetical protein [Leptospira sp. 96542]
MAQQATQVLNPTIEKEAWELYEVGSTEDVLVLSKKHPENFYVQHLSYLCAYELTGRGSFPSPKGISPLAPMVEAIVNFELGKYKEAATSVNLYFGVDSNPICFSLIQLALKIYFRADIYDKAYSIIVKYRKTWNDFSFIKEEISCAYFLKRYDEVIRIFRDHMKALNDTEIHKLVGMSLLFLDRHKEAGLIFDNIPNKLNLPSFEEKKKSYEAIYAKLGGMETNQTKLDHKELEDIGFAYLFHGEYDKAEKMFLTLTEKLKSKLCNV